MSYVTNLERGVHHEVITLHGRPQIIEGIQNERSANPSKAQINAVWQVLREVEPYSQLPESMRLLRRLFPRDLAQVYKENRLTGLVSSLRTNDLGDDPENKRIARTAKKYLGFRN